MVDVNQYISIIRNLISEVDCATLSGELEKSPIIIDVRESEETAQGIIPGAITIPRGVLEMQITQHPRLMQACTDKPLEELDIYLYCRSGGRSALAAHTLNALGFSAVYSLAGGFNQWCKEKLPTVQAG